MKELVDRETQYNVRKIITDLVSQGHDLYKVIQKQ